MDIYRPPFEIDRRCDALRTLDVFLLAGCLNVTVTFADAARPAIGVNATITVVSSTWRFANDARPFAFNDSASE
jgi:hypothetical protein